MNDIFQSLSHELIALLADYASLQSPRLLRFPQGLPFIAVHGFLLDHVLLNTHFQAYPPSPQYQVSFWKRAISFLESRISSEDDEIDDRIFDYYLSLMTPSHRPQTIGESPPPPSFVTYIWNDGKNYRTGTLLESQTTIESGTTGLKTWPASLVLADYLLSRPELVSHRNVLELGSGAGLLGVIVASLQTNSRCFAEEEDHPSLLVTDARQDVLGRCQDNLALSCNESSLHPRVQCLLLDWTDALDSSQRPVVSAKGSTADIILGADIVFDPSIIPALVATLVLLLEPTAQCQRSALIALSVRNPSTISMFLEVLGSSLHTEDVEVSQDRSAFVGNGNPLVDQDVRIYRLTYPNT